MRESRKTHPFDCSLWTVGPWGNSRVTWVDDVNAMTRNPGTEYVPWTKSTLGGGRNVLGRREIEHKQRDGQVRTS